MLDSQHSELRTGLVTALILSALGGLVVLLLTADVGQALVALLLGLAIGSAVFLVLARSRNDRT